MNEKRPLVLIRGGGDLASGVAVRLHRSGFGVVVTEVAQPLAVRRLVALAEAVFANEVMVEDVRGQRVSSVEEAWAKLACGAIPVIVDPEVECRLSLSPEAIVDGRMLKTDPGVELSYAPLVVGLGPGFEAGVHCHAVVETNRGHHLGRVIWEGRAEPDTGVPEGVAGFDVERVLRAPASGELHGHINLGTLVKRGELIATVDGHRLEAPFDGALRGLVHSGLTVGVGLKVGDLDPRQQPAFCYQISDKALAIAGGVLEALLSSPEIRQRLGA